MSLAPSHARRRRKRLTRKQIARKAAKTKKQRKEIRLFDTILKDLREGLSPFECALKHGMTLQEFERAVEKAVSFANKILDKLAEPQRSNFERDIKTLQERLAQRFNPSQEENKEGE